MELNETEKFISGDLRLKIGIQIKSFREKKGYNQEELAQIMGITRSTISKIENGKFSITVDYLEKFANHLEFNVLLREKSIKNT